MSMRIMDVGQCGFDGPRMATLWKRELGATVDQAASSADALAKAKKTHYDVILVNRVLAADGSSGLEVIQELLKAKTPSPVMLVSDIQEAQDQATAMGAAPGFGKSELGDPATIEHIKKIAGK